MSSKMDSVLQQICKKSLNDINVIFVVTSGNPFLDCLGLIFKHRENLPYLLEKYIFKPNLDIFQLRLLGSKVLSQLRMHAIQKYDKTFKRFKVSYHQLKMF